MELLEDEAQLLVAQVGQLVVIETVHLRAVEPVPTGGGAVQTAEDVHRRALA